MTPKHGGWRPGRGSPPPSRRRPRGVRATFALVLVVAPAAAAAQATGSAAEPTIPGTAVVHVSPVEGDTLPILCNDRERPELGFVTETGDAEWTPRLALTFSRAGDDPAEAQVLLELDGASYAAAFPAGESGEGFYTAVATVVADGGSPMRMISFTASCRERLTRGG